MTGNEGVRAGVALSSSAAPIFKPPTPLTAKEDAAKASKPAAIKQTKPRRIFTLEVWDPGVETRNIESASCSARPNSRCKIFDPVAARDLKA